MTARLAIAHDSRSIMATVTPSPLMDVHLLVFKLEGEAVPRTIELPKKLFPSPLLVDQQLILTITYTQAAVVADKPSVLLPPGAMQ